MRTIAHLSKIPIINSVLNLNILPSQYIIIDRIDIPHTNRPVSVEHKALDSHADQLYKSGVVEHAALASALV